MTEEAFEAQMEAIQCIWLHWSQADAQIDADFRNLEALGRCNSSMMQSKFHG